MLRLNVDMKSIGEVATRFDLPTHVLRHWESVGLLTPTRVNGGQRRYSDADIYRVAAIVVAKQSGFGLPEIRTMLESGNAATRHAVIAEHRAALEARIAQAQALLAMIGGAQECAHDDVMTCPNFQGLVRAIPGCEDLVPPRS